MVSQLLVPMDDSEPARAALEYALERFPDDEITVVHAVDDLEAGYAGNPSAVAEEFRPGVLDDATRIADEYGTRIETRVLEGQPADEILRYIEEQEIDGIVIGNKRRAGVSRVLWGSVAERVARCSSVPVTIVP